MEHLIFFVYVLLFSSGFAGGASLAYLWVRYRSSSLPYFMAIQTAYLVGLAFQAIDFYFGNIASAAGIADLRPLQVAAGIAGAALYWLAWGAFASEGLFGRSSRSFLPTFVSISLLSTACLMSLGVAAALFGASLGVPPFLSYLPATVSIASAGVLLTVGRLEGEPAPLRGLLRGYGLALLSFVPLTFVEAALETSELIPYRPLSLDFLFFFLWSCSAIYGACRSAVPGRSPEPPALLRSVPGPLAERFSLSPRECETILLIARGLPNKGIAAELGISPATVRTHIYNVFRKVGARSRIELFALLKASAESSEPAAS
jgi:DNA-binding CsgD family transcriptional regulator